MGFLNNGNKQNQNQTERVYLDLKGLMVTVMNCRVISDTCVSFTLKCRGFSLYNMRLLDKNGQYYVMPHATKGNNGKYYDQYAIYLTEDDRKVLIDTVMQELNREKN